MTDDLVQFLRDRMAEDEAHAKKDVRAADNATTGNWRAHYGESLPYSIIKADDITILRAESDQHQADVLLATRFKPETVRSRAERMLAEVDAKRRILALHEPEPSAADGPADPPVTVCRECGPSTDELWTYNPSSTGGDWYPCATARLLALPYRDHAEYQAAWAAES